MFLNAVIPVISQLEDLSTRPSPAARRRRRHLGCRDHPDHPLSRFVVLPFTLRSMHGMREMQALQPYIKEIQEKYKDDRQRMQREQMALWEHG